MLKIKSKKFNVLLIGDSKVGKTCICSVYKYHKFVEKSLQTISLETIPDSHKINGRDYLFKLYDSAGADRYKSITENLIKISDAILLVFSVDDRKSFESIAVWIKIIKENANNREIILILIGNKIDSKYREVTNEEIIIFSISNYLKYFETSAKTGFGIQELFNQLYEDIYIKFIKDK